MDLMERINKTNRILAIHYTLTDRLYSGMYTSTAKVYKAMSIVVKLKRKMERINNV